MIARPGNGPYRRHGDLLEVAKEGANFLALNLANDVIESERTVDEARAYCAQTIQKVKQGEEPEYAQDLQFETQTTMTGEELESMHEAGEEM